eukprot:2927793-Pleurochrysis_carterae.AAC.1
MGAQAAPWLAAKSAELSSDENGFCRVALGILKTTVTAPRRHIVIYWLLRTSLMTAPLCGVALRAPPRTAFVEIPCAWWGVPAASKDA